MYRCSKGQSGDQLCNWDLYLSTGKNINLLYRYWWNTRSFPFTKKSYLHRGQWRYYFYLSRVRILVSPWLLTWLANYKSMQESSLRSRRLEVGGTKKQRRLARELPALVTKYYCLYFSFISLYPRFITFLWQAFCDRWPLRLHYFAVSKMNLKKLCFM